MKKGNRQKVQLSKNAKKVLAGVLATSMTLSGTMFAFADSETATSAESIELTSAAAVKYGHSIADTLYGDVLELASKDPKGNANNSGVEVDNPFKGADVKEAITPTALKDDAELIAHLIPVMSGSAVDYYKVGSEATLADAKKAFDADVIDAVVSKRNDGKTANDFVVSGDTVVVSGEGSLAAEIDGTTVNVVNQTTLPESSWLANPYEQGEFNFPLPNFQKGVSISTWVKVPEGTTTAAPIFTFLFDSPKQSGWYGNLTLDTDGAFCFTQYGRNWNSDGNGGKNAFKATFDSADTPLKKAGNWVYVTVSIQNDEFHVYYNGKAATKVDYKQAINGSNLFSAVYYYKFRQDKVGDGANSFTDEERIKYVYISGGRNKVSGKVLQGLSVTGDAIYDAGNWSYNKIDNWSGDTPNSWLTMNLLTAGTTKLYFGGVPTTGLTQTGNNLANINNACVPCLYSDDCIGMEMRGMTATMTPVDATEAAAAYKSADAAKNSYLTVVENAANKPNTVTTNTSGASIKIVAGGTQGVEMKNTLIDNKESITETINDAMKGQILVAHVKKSGDGYSIVAEQTRKEAMAAFDTDVLNAISDMALEGVDMPVVSLNEAGDGVYGKGGKKIADISGTTITAVDRIKVSLASKWAESPYAQTDYKFPLPSYSKGVTLSAWVKVKQGESDPATIFEFVGGNEALVLDTDGKLVYRQDASIGSANTNTYSATYGGTTPVANAGKWTYVTLTIKNDEIQVYYNGALASASYAKYNNNDYAAFNGGLGWKQNSKDGDRVKNLVAAGRYTEIKHGKSVWNLTASHLIMDFLTASSTKLFLGGSATALYDYAGQIGNFTAAADGMQIYGVTYETTPITAAEAAEKYKEENTEHKAAGSENATEEYAKNVQSISFDTAKLNSDINSSTKTTTEDLGDIITLGKITEEEKDNSYSWAGVELDNPFREKSGLLETLPQAFENSGKKFNGFLTYQNNAFGDETPASAGVSDNGWVITSYPTTFWMGDRPTDTTDTKKTYEYYWFGAPSDVNLNKAGSVFLTKQDAINAYYTAKSQIESYIDDGIVADYLAQDAKYFTLTSAQKETEKNKDDSDTTKVRFLERGQDWDKAKEADRSTMKAYLNAISGSATANGGLSEDLVAYTYNGPQRCYPTITLSELNAMDEFSYPLPVWTKGGSVSTWVKVPKGATESAVVLTFSDGTGALTLRTDGTVYFTDGTETNTYKSVFVGRTPLDNAGNWTYVTMSIQNDGVDVYYDGEKATESLQTKIGSNGSKYFNKGFGTHQGNNTERVTQLLINDSYQELFSQVTGTATDAAAAAKLTNDYSNYLGSSRAGTLLVDFLVKKQTNLYLGGYTDAVSLAQYTDANDGMQFDDVTYTLYPLGEEEASAAYSAAATHAGELNARIPLVDTNANFATTVLSSGDAAKVAEDASLGNVVELEGAATNTAVGIKIANPFIGKEELVESVTEALDNAKTPVYAALEKATDSNSGKQYYKVKSYSTKSAAKTAYDKEVAEAQKIVLASAQAVDPTVTANDVHAIGGEVRAFVNGTEVRDKNNKAISVTLNWKEDPADQSEYTFPLPVYKQGASFSTWVKVAEDTTEPATVFTFYKDQEILTLDSDGTLVYCQVADGTSANTNDAPSKRNIYRAEYKGKTSKGGTPLANKGEWTYVTVTIKNDELQVYYNGIQSEVSSYFWHKSNSRVFNGGFDFKRNDQTDAQRIATLVSNGRYQNILKNYGLDDVTYNQEGMWNPENQATIMEFLTDEDTELYLGGIAQKVVTEDGTLADTANDPTVWSNDRYTEEGIGYPSIGHYSAANAGMQFKNVDVCFYPANAGQALQLYKTAAADVAEQAEEYVEPSPEPTESEAPSESPSPSPSASVSPAPDESESPEPTETTAPVDYTLGDINNDGDIDLTDAQLALQLYLDLDEVKNLTDAQKKAADVNQNDDTDLNDVQQILQYYLGDITEFVKE